MDMRPLALGCVFYLCFQGAAFAQALPGQIDPQRTPALSPHFEPEHAYDAPVNSERWTHVPPGLHVAFETTDAIHFRSEVPGVTDDARAWDATAWRGERLNAVVLVWSPDALEQVRFDVTDLADANGHTLSGGNLHLRLVRYVLSNYPAGARDATCDASPGGAWLLPDRLEPFDRFDLPGRTVRPVWLSLDVPAGATAGAYEGTLRVTAGKQTATLRMKIDVQLAVLPPPREWTFRLDLWQNPWVIAWYYPRAAMVRRTQGAA